MRVWILAIWVACAGLIGCNRTATEPTSAAAPSSVFTLEEGFVDANGVMIYYKTIGSGEPLMILHGGPGGTHNVFLPHLLPLAKANKLIFIDERGGGKSQEVEDASQYTVENMVEDVEAVRRELKLGTISLLGHSCGGVLAQAYAFKYQQNLKSLILAGTFHSTKQLNEVFVKMKANMPKELRERIEKMEREGVYGKGKDYEKRRYTNEYMEAAWGEGYWPYTYGRRPDPAYSPASPSAFAWDVYRVMWGTTGEFVVDGNMVSVEYADRLSSIKVPTLITVGDHDQVDPSISRDIHAKLPGSKLVVLPDSGHMMFVDQPSMFNKAVDDFIHGRQ